MISDDVVSGGTFHPWLHKIMLRKEGLCVIVYYMSVSTFYANKATNR